MAKELANKKNKAGDNTRIICECIKNHVKIATAVAIRATVATNIAQPALREKTKGILRMTKALANKIKTKRATKRE